MEITTDFEAGSGRLVGVGERHWRLETVGESFGYNKYFCFRVTTAADEPVRFLRVDVVPDPALPKSHFMTHFPGPLWCMERGWNRWGPLRRTWEDAVVFHPEHVEIRFPVPAGKTLYIATNPIRRYTEHRAWIEETAARSGGRLGVESIGKSFEGRDIAVLRMGKAGKPRLLVLAAQHSSEHSGVWACEGMVEYLLSALTEARRVADGFDLAIIPMFNPDGNVHGLSASNTQYLSVNNSMDFSGVATGQRPQMHDNRLLWDWLARNFHPDVMLHIHGYLGWKGHGDAPGDGIYLHANPEQYIKDEGRRATLRAILDRMLFDTPGYTAHFRHTGTMTDAMLDEQISRAYGTIGLLYEINTGTVGPYEQFRRGPQILTAMARACLDDVPLEKS